MFCRLGYGSEGLHQPDHIVLVLEAENASHDTREVPVNYILPKEILPEHIQEQGVFSIDYNSKADRYYLSADIAFNPYEIKTFYIPVKNIWFIPEQHISRYISSAKNIYERIAKKADAAAKHEAEAIFDFVRRESAKIMQDQAEDKTVSEHISSFHKNERMVEGIKNGLERLRELDSEKVKQADSHRSNDKNKDMIEMIMLTTIAFVLLFTIISCHLWITRFKKDKKTLPNKN
jgi:hypothetical protein